MLLAELMMMMKLRNSRRCSQSIFVCLQVCLVKSISCLIFFFKMNRFTNPILNFHLLDIMNSNNDTDIYPANYTRTNITSYQNEMSTVIGGDGVSLRGRSAEVALEYYIPYAVTFLSTLATLSVFYVVGLVEKQKKKKHWKLKENLNARSTTLPGYGTLGDTVNEVVELFLNTLAIYVHNDGNRDCPRRMLCEANQRAADYGMGYGVTTYFLSLAVSFLLEGQRVSESMEAMRRGRHGMDCRYSYPRCPFSLRR